MNWFHGRSLLKALMTSCAIGPREGSDARSPYINTPSLASE
jgi:hypothetical protein